MRPGFRQVIECLALVEATHLDRPLDRFTFAADREPAAAIACNRDDAAIDRRGKGAVDCDFGLTGDFAFFQCREIEERKSHGALDLDRPVAGQKNHGGMGVDALDRQATMTGGIAKKVDYRLLRGLCRHCAAPFIPAPQWQSRTISG